MSIKVLIKRTVPQEKSREMLNLFKEMRSLATGQEGYISGETLKSTDRLDVFLVISTWASSADWETGLRTKSGRRFKPKLMLCWVVIHLMKCFSMDCGNDVIV